MRVKNLPERKNLEFFLDSTLHSYSQILFSENRILGFVILLASFIYPFSGLNGLIGALFINLFAYKLGHSRREIRVGIYGFNGILFGMALSLYSGTGGLQIVLFVILFSILLTVIKTSAATFFQKYSLPFLSTPFVLLSWIVILTGAGAVNGASGLLDVQFEGYSFLYLVKSFLKNIGHIIFSPDEISGLLISAVLLYYSRTMLFIAALSFTAIVGFSYGFPQYSHYVINNGFNAILTSIAIGGVFFAPGLMSLSMAVFASVFTVIIGNIMVEFFSPYNIPVLAAPFNLVTILFIYAMQHNVSEAGLYRIYMPDSPEDNYKRFIRDSETSGKVDRGFVLPFMGWWFVSQGVNGKHTHQGIYKWGVDFIVTDKNGKPYKDTGNELSEHYCYDMPVTSPCDGIVFAAESSTPDNPVTKTNLDYSWGNFVIVQHNPSLFSVLCHFGQKRVFVNTNKILRKGDTIGNVGSSGLAPYPHLHVQFQSSGLIGGGTIPVYFSDYLIRNEDCYEYVPLGIPEKRQVVSNIPIDYHVKDEIGFELEQTTSYELIKNGKKHCEVWTCDMDSAGILFIESSLYKDRLFFTKDERSISFIKYTGGKNSGLYMLGLAIDKIPFYTNARLKWKRRIPYFEMLTGIKSFLWGTIMPFLNCNYIYAAHTFKTAGGRFVLSSIFRNGKGRIAERSILFDNGLSEINYQTENKYISLTRVA